MTSQVIESPIDKIFSLPEQAIDAEDKGKKTKLRIESCEDSRCERKPAEVAALDDE